MDDMKDKLEIEPARARFPYCIGETMFYWNISYLPHLVWTPLPCISWLIPPIGHMGIAYSTGVIRDFAGPYYVSEDNLAFGRTTRYYQLEPQHVKAMGWDRAVHEASEEYKKRMHNICWFEFILRNRKKTLF